MEQEKELKFKKGQSVRFIELGRDFIGEVILGLVTDIGDEGYLVAIGGRQVMKYVDELDAVDAGKE